MPYVPTDFFPLCHSRFLLQATFGANLTSIRELAKTFNPKQDQAWREKWLQDQMAVPATLHRAYWRKRVSPKFMERVSTNSKASARKRSERGSTFAPWGACKSGSRWLRIAADPQSTD